MSERFPDDDFFIGEERGEGPLEILPHTANAVGGIAEVVAVGEEAQVVNCNII